MPPIFRSQDFSFRNQDHLSYTGFPRYVAFTGLPRKLLKGTLRTSLLLVFRKTKGITQTNFNAENVHYLKMGNKAKRFIGFI